MYYTKRLKMCDMVLACVLITTSMAVQPSVYHGVISVGSQAANSSHKFCATTNPDWFSSKLYTTEENAPSFDLFDVSVPLNGCDKDNFVVNNIKNKTVILVDTGSCTVEERITNAVDVGGARLIIIARVDGGLNISDVKNNNFSSQIIVLVNKNTYDSIQNLGVTEDLFISFYVPTLNFDSNIIVIYIICLFCIIAGSYWSLYPRNMKLSEFWLTSPKPPIRLVLQTEDTEESKKSSICCNLMFGGVIVGIMAGMLLGTYFAYDYFVFVFIALFCIIASTGLYHIVYPFLAMFKCFEIQWRITIFSKEKIIPPMNVVLWIFCSTVSIIWFIYRHCENIWPLQVFLGIAICLNIITSVPMPNLKIITIIMMMLFVYDIFFVFITPYFTKDGMSIMEKVATGSSGRSHGFDAPSENKATEQIPLSIKVPYFQDSDLVVCAPLYSLIGFGDIVIPGLLTGYAAYFDTLAHSDGTKWYYIISCLSYAIGLAITYIALIFMKIAQPALLYLVPCTLSGILLVALVRRDIYIIWTGRADPSGPETFENDSIDSNS